METGSWRGAVERFRPRNSESRCLRAEGLNAFQGVPWTGHFRSGYSAGNEGMNLGIPLREAIRGGLMMRWCIRTPPHPDFEHQHKENIATNCYSTAGSTCHVPSKPIRGRSPAHTSRRIANPELNAAHFQGEAVVSRNHPTVSHSMNQRGVLLRSPNCLLATQLPLKTKPIKSLLAPRRYQAEVLFFSGGASGPLPCAVPPPQNDLLGTLGLPDFMFCSSFFTLGPPVERLE